jgi:hypothetical protein
MTASVNLTIQQYMRKLIFILLLAGSNILFSTAQTKSLQFAVGPAVSFPTGDLSTLSPIGFGVEVSATYSFSDKFSGFGQTGAQLFTGRQIIMGYRTSSLTNIPVLVGIKYLIEEFRLGLGLGYGTFLASGSSLNGFTINPQISYDLGKVDVGAHYSSTSLRGGSLNHFGLKAAYKF